MPENVPYAREVLNAPPTTPTPATDYFIRQPDGRIEHWISDLAAPHPLRPVSFNVAVTGAPPPTDVTRSGGAAGVTLSNVSYVEQTVRPTVNIPLTALVLENATAAGAGPVALAVLDVATSTWLGAGTAAVSGSGLQAPVNLTLLAGREYRIRAGSLGSGVNGTQYDGYLGSVTLGTGYAWTGLNTTGGVAYWDGTYKTVADATQQLPLQYVTGDMTGFDPSGMTIRGTDPVQVTYDAEARTYTVGLTSGEETTDALPSGNTLTGGNYYQVGQAATFTVLEPVTLTAVRQQWIGLTGVSVLHNGSVVQAFAGLDVNNALHTLALTAALTLNAGDTLAFRVDSAGANGASPLGTIVGQSVPASLTTTGGTLRWDNPSGSGWLCEFDLAGGGLGITTIPGLPEALGGKASAADLAAVDARVTALEGRASLDAEAVQDIVGAMFGGTQGTYDDAAGTYTVNLPSGSSLTDEQVQDIVAALIQAGTNATVTYDDAANTLTISASGGGGSVGAVYLSNQVNAQYGYGLTWQSYAAAGSATTVYQAVQSISFNVVDLPYSACTADGSLMPASTPVDILVGGNVVASGTATLVSGTSNRAVLNATVSVAAGQQFSVRISTKQPLINGIGVGDISPDGRLQLVSSPYGRPFAFLLSSNAPAPGKNVTGPLDPLDFPVVDGVGSIPNGGTARLRGAGKIYIRTSTGQLYEFVGTAVSG